MLETFKEYIQKHYAFDNLFGEQEGIDPNLSLNKFKLSPGRRVLLVLLRSSPWICFVGFVLTFAISVLPVAQVEAFFAEYEVFVRAGLIVSVSGLIGYGTNYVAIRMLFRPVDKRPIWGQGLIPAQRNRIINSLAKGMHTHILSQELIRRRVEESGLVKKINHLVIDGTIALINDQELRELLKVQLRESLNTVVEQESFQNEMLSIIDERLEDSFDDGVKRFLLRTYKRLNAEDYRKGIIKMVEALPEAAVDVVERMEGELDRLAAYVRQRRPATAQMIMQAFIDTLYKIDIAALLRNQMAHFDEARLEKMVWEATNEQLLYIQYLGTILGILGGLLIWNPLNTIIAYLIIFGALYLLDNLIYKLRPPVKEEE